GIRDFHVTGVQTCALPILQKEIENMLYVWNMGSRAGRQAQQLFPFGKPYADMMGFWGRELFKRPVLRGVFTNDNWLNLEAIANRSEERRVGKGGGAGGRL